jgi:hypothetical protein
VDIIYLVVIIQQEYFHIQINSLLQIFKYVTNVMIVDVINAILIKVALVHLIAILVMDMLLNKLKHNKQVHVHFVLIVQLLIVYNVIVLILLDV